MNPETRTTWTSAVALAVVLVTGVFRWFDAQAWPLVPVPELLVLWAARGVGTKAWNRPWSLFLRVVVWALGGLVVVWTLGEAFYRFFYRDHFDVLTDLGLVPGLLDMVTGASFFRSAWGLGTTALALGAVVLGLGWAAEVPGRTPVPARLRGPLALVLLVAAGAQYALWPGDSPVTRAVQTTLERSLPSPATVAPPEAGAGATEDPAGDAPESVIAPGLWLLVVESYGHTVYDQEDYLRALGPSLEAFDKALAHGGWSVKSGFFRSPTFGGRSWLADATILAGRRITNQTAYDEAVRRREPNLTHELGRRGYHRILAAPGTLQADDEWKATYAFDTYLFDGEFGYRGPAIGGLGRLSDQFLLERLAREPRTGPVFAMAVLVSSHTPFQRLPVYFDDWDDLGDGSVYREPGHIRAFTDLKEGYLASLEYVFQCLGGFLSRGPGPDDVVIVVGDHQPLVPVSDQEATFSVPLHVLTRNPERLEGLGAWDLEPGLVPGARPLPHPGMEGVADLIRRVLGITGPEVPAQAANEKRPRLLPGPKGRSPIMGGAPGPEQSRYGTQVNTAAWVPPWRALP